MANLINKLKYVQFEFEQLKKAFNVPKLYIHNYFADLKSKVDFYYNKTDIQNETNTKIWLDIIRKIEFYEKECFKTFVKFHDDTIEKTKETISLIEAKLASLNSNNLEINFKSKKAEKIIENLSYLVYDKLLEIERILFNNKKMLFIQINDSEKLQKLIFISNDYFSRIGTQIIKKYV